MSAGGPTVLAMLAVEAQTVVGLRLMMLGSGGTAALIEVHRYKNGMAPVQLGDSSVSPVRSETFEHGMEHGAMSSPGLDPAAKLSSRRPRQYFFET